MLKLKLDPPNPPVAGVPPNENPPGAPPAAPNELAAGVAATLK